MASVCPIPMCRRGPMKARGDDLIHRMNSGLRQGIPGVRTAEQDGKSGDVQMRLRSHEIAIRAAFNSDDVE
jgi:hypothetical protein